MKTTHLIIPMILLIGSLFGCGETKNRQDAKVESAEEIKDKKAATLDVADVSWKDGMTGKLFHNYLQLKMSLVNSDADGAATAAGNLAESLDERMEIKEIAVKISDTKELDDQRAAFSQLTEQLEPLFKESLSEGTIYKQYCPMAFNNQGAYWFADIKEIRNPYFGDKMLKCGRVDETISGK
ncbi:MAG: DUF3347 domain-containing protein [Marinoscillum sp.]